MSLIREKDKETGGDEESHRDLRAAEFFREVLTPAALRERAEGREFFALRPDAAAESYFVEPTRCVLTREDFELRAAESIEEFVAALAALWTAEGRDGLAAMAQQLLKLASEVGEGEEQREDVSPFMYVMF
jgi:hypothetical protein